MFGSIFSFEIRRWVKSVSTYVYFLILFVVAFLFALLLGGAFKGAEVNLFGEKIYMNSPAIADIFFSFVNNYVGIIIVVAVVGNAVLKDFKNNTHLLIFTTSVSKFDYLFGRFSSSLFVCLILAMAPALGMMLGYASPWVNPDKIEAFSLAPYIMTYWQTVVPNMFLFGAIFFAVSLIARDIFIIWLSLIIFYVAVGVSNSFFTSLEHEKLSALADPLGGHAKSIMSKYWTADQKNHNLYKMEGLFLLNRLIWIGVSLVLLVIGYFSFSFTATARRLVIRRPKLMEKMANVFTQPAIKLEKLPRVTQSFTTGSNLKNLWGLAVNECKTLMRNIYFRIILLFGMLFLFLVSLQIGKILDTTTFPLTDVVIEYFEGVFSLFTIIITIMFSGELVWRARENRMSNILDALPVPNWVFYVSKVMGLMFLQVLLLCVIMVCGIIVQTVKGYTHYEILLYIKYLFGFKLIDLWLLAILAIFVQSLVSNKYIGFFIVILFYAWNTLFAETVLKYNFLVFGSDPGVFYSDMNKFEHSVFPFIIYKVYWGALALCLAVLSSLLWARGSEDRIGLRWAEAKKRTARPSWAVFVISLLVFIGCGSFIYYSTTVQNKFLTDNEQEEQQVKYEKTYKKFEHIPQPKITAVTLNVDIYPNERSLKASGSYVIKNKTQFAIDSVHVLMANSEVTVTKMSFAVPAQQVCKDSANGYSIYKLSKPMQPGDSLILSFAVEMATKGFKASFTGLSMPLYNGTFVNNEGFLPYIGYNNGAEISDNSKRKKYGLPYRRTAYPITDTAEYQFNTFVQDADFIDFDATVSTVPDQIAIAPGYLQREWVENGRRYFHYKMDKPILNFYSFLSARYLVKKDKWNDVDIEIYYHEGHEYNLDRMIRSVKKSLAYYTANYSPYQYRQLRILEFPRYATFAQSFPNTIPFSEGIGFIAKVDDSDMDQVDYPFYVTAHETGHQWWAHQVVGANVQGSNMLSETLAEYSAIMVLEKEYGEERIRKFLHIEMDQYLSRRSNEAEKENALAYVDIGQAYILYQKGGILMRALTKYVGEDSINHALKHFLEKYAFKGPPYPTTLDLVACIREVTPDSLQYMVTDVFQKIILYDNKVTAVKSTKTADGYTVDFTVDSKKISADSTGKETPIPSDDYIEVGVYGKKKEMLQLMRYKLKGGETKLSMHVAEEPVRVVVDPRLLLIDKDLKDNEKRFTKDGDNDKGDDKKKSGVKVSAGR